ncbi:MAG TPA: LysR family transcriptional regulator [Acidimicrobiales bacterium]|nr:LysR family transcriptional regulator [Acidimicrobiales bacterium]
MDFRRLTYFLAVVDNGGFTAAADEVDVSQPALSLAVKELERDLGTALFDRVGRGVRLTPAGEALVEPARQALRDVETGRAAVDAVTGVRAGSLALACLPTLAADPVAGLVGQFRTRFPGVTVDLAAPEDSADLVTMIRDGRCEAGITEASPVPAGLVSHDVGTQALLLILPPGPTSAGRTGGHPSTDDPAMTLTVSDLAGVAFVAAPVGTSTRRLLDEGFAAAGAVPEVAVVTAQRDAILPLVLAGAGAALVPEPIAEVARALGARVARPGPVIERSIALVHRSGPLAPAAGRFVDLATGG